MTAMRSFECCLTIICLILFTLYYRTQRYLQRNFIQVSSLSELMVSPPARLASKLSNPRQALDTPDEIKDTRRHIARTLVTMKKRIGRREKDQCPSEDWGNEMLLTRRPRWSTQKDNMVLLTGVNQARDGPEFAELADMLGCGKYSAPALQYAPHRTRTCYIADLIPCSHRFDYLIYALYPRFSNKKKAEHTWHPMDAPVE